MMLKGIVSWVGLTFAFSAPMVFAADGCEKYLKSKSGTTEVRDLPVTWTSSEGANIKAAGDYEIQAKAQGVEADPAQLAQILGGSVVHLRLTKLPNGLRYVTIHKADGTQIFDHTAYVGLISCNCGQIHDSPAVSTPDVVYGVDLGDGFTLSSITSGVSTGSLSTCTNAVKKYWLSGDTKVELRYAAEPKSKEDFGYLNIGYKAVSHENRAPVGTDIVRVTSQIVEAKLNFYQGNHRESEITVGYNLSDTPWKPQWDQVTFKFDPNGQLSEIVGISESKTTNPHWTAPEFSRAVRKGENRWFRYVPGGEKAAVIFKAVFGREISSLEGLSFFSVNHIMKAATDEKPLDLPSLLNFRR